MRAFIPVDTPRVVIPADGSYAAIQEPTRVTLVSLPLGEPFGVIETTGDIGWLGARLLVTNHTVVRVVDPKTATIVAERTFDAPVRIHAWVGGHALVSCADRLLVVDDRLESHEVTLVPVPEKATSLHDTFVIAVGDTLREIDPISAQWKRTWQVSASSFGGNARSLWYITDAARDRIHVVRLVMLAQAMEHVFPERLVAATGHPTIDLVVAIGESGRVYVIDLASRRPAVALDTGTVVHAESVGLVVNAGMVVAEAQRPIQFVPFDIPTWRHELIAWTRSGVVERFPLVPAIAELAHRLGLEVDLLPAITLCYGAHLCQAPGVPVDELAEMLGGRWPEEARGEGLLAQTGLLVFSDGWASLAPAYRAALDDVT